MKNLLKVLLVLAFSTSAFAAQPQHTDKELHEMFSNGTLTRSVYESLDPDKKAVLHLTQDQVNKLPTEAHSSGK